MTEEKITETLPICLSCKHLILERGFKCEAFPDGIPDEIAFSENDHNKPYPGDHGIQFEPMD